MQLAWLGVGLLAGAGLLATLLAALVLRTDATRAANRRLALVLGAETLFLLTLLVSQLAFGGEDQQPRWLEAASFGAIASVSASYLLLLAIVDTPLTRPFRHPWALRALAAAVLALLASAYVFGTPAGHEENPMTLVNGVLGTLAIVGAGAFGIVATASAYRRTTPGTPARQRARVLLAAFVTRDAMWILTTGGGVYFSNAGQQDLGDFFWGYGAAVVVLAYVPLLTYGILRTQLFDIDLKLKVGIRRSTVVTLALVVVLAAAKVAEFYLNKTYGFIAGGVAAGVMLVLTPRLNKLGDKVASSAMPKVSDAPAYVQFRKLEVYKAALEAAHEGGEPTPKERGTLERLRAKLGISESDAAALEADLRAPAA